MHTSVVSVAMVPLITWHALICGLITEREEAVEEEQLATPALLADGFLLILKIGRSGMVGCQCRWMRARGRRCVEVGVVVVLLVVELAEVDPREHHC
jgi:hypothetical protein